MIELIVHVFYRWMEIGDSYIDDDLVKEYECKWEIRMT